MKKSLIISSVAGLILLTSIGVPKIKKHITEQNNLNRYDQIFLIESKKHSKNELTLEDSLNFYEAHGLMSYAVWEYSDLMNADANRWRFQEIPYTEIERIVKEHEMSTKFK